MIFHATWLRRFGRFPGRFMGVELGGMGKQFHSSPTQIKAIFGVGFHTNTH